MRNIARGLAELATTCICLFSLPCIAATVSVSVPGQTSWLDTGVTVSVGNPLKITAGGTIQVDYPPANTQTPDGDPSDQGIAQGASPPFLAPNLTVWSLIARIGNDPPFEVGSSFSASTIHSGRLYLGVNDNRFFDNSGAWQASIKFQQQVTFLYNYAYQRVDTTFASAGYTVARPRIDPADSHSLAEIAAQSADQQQIVEVGWTVDPGLNGDANPHLFVFHWVNGVAIGYNGHGFVSTSKTIKPGMTLSTSSAALLRFAIKFANGNWWVYAGSQPFGYFPGTLWNGNFTQMNLVEWFGEVAASSSMPRTAMGDGVLGTQHGSARIASMKILDAGSNQLVPASAGMGTVQNPDYYDIGFFKGASFRYGGPGAR